MAFSWSQQGMILRPPDYESGATNQLSYGTFFLLLFGDFCVGLHILSQSLPLGSSFLRHLSAVNPSKISCETILFGDFCVGPKISCENRSKN